MKFILEILLKICANFCAKKNAQNCVELSAHQYYVGS